MDRKDDMARAEAEIIKRVDDAERTRLVELALAAIRKDSQIAHQDR